jgi:hypothetical protein
MTGPAPPTILIIELLIRGDGWQFRAERMAHPAWRDVPVVVGTAIGKMPGTMPESLATPEDDRLLEPAGVDALPAPVGRHDPRRRRVARGPGAVGAGGP